MTGNEYLPNTTVELKDWQICCENNRKYVQELVKNQHFSYFSKQTPFYKILFRIQNEYLKPVSELHVELSLFHTLYCMVPEVIAWFDEIQAMVTVWHGVLSEKPAPSAAWWPKTQYRHKSKIERLMTILFATFSIFFFNAFLFKPSLPPPPV